jgi:hypothetical protein
MSARRGARTTPFGVFRSAGNRTLLDDRNRHAGIGAFALSGTDPASQPWFSAASLWEVAIKHASAGRTSASNRAGCAGGCSTMAGENWRYPASMWWPLSTCPASRGPVDRMLLAQTQVEGLALVTSDERVARYAGNVLKV